jgi:hypothetical protein
VSAATVVRANAGIASDVLTMVNRPGIPGDSKL